MRLGWTGAVSLWLSSAALSAAAELRWVSTPGQPEAAVVEVTGFTDAEWSRAGTGLEWSEVLVVRADSDSLQVRPDLPAMLGGYEVAEKTLRFTPRFPLVPGLRYSAVLRSARLSGDDQARPQTAVYRFEAEAAGEATRVTTVHPTAAVLPMNLLKVYLHFSAPMSRGAVYSHVRVLDAQSRPVELAFLELEEELWNAEQTRLTLLFDPGRIKRGLLPREQEGPVFEEGKSYTLEIDAAWPDAQGRPLAGSCRKTFTAGAADETAPDPARWQVAAPPAGTRQPLTVRFDEPMDSALARRLIWVETEAGMPLEGAVALVEEDRCWHMTPTLPWPRGAAVVWVKPLIEDLAGNQIGKVFDVDVFENQAPGDSGRSAALRFTLE